MNRVFTAIGAVVLFGALLSCSRAEQTGAPPEPAARGATAPVIDLPGQPPVAASPESILEPDAIEVIQSALQERGYRVEVNGALDPSTQRALRSFQAREGLAATGMPGRESLRRLGLNPTELYRGSRTEDDG